MKYEVIHKRSTKANKDICQSDTRLQAWECLSDQGACVLSSLYKDAVISTAISNNVRVA